jgi:hypothetical protein
MSVKIPTEVIIRALEYTSGCITCPECRDIIKNTILQLEEIEQ